VSTKFANDPAPDTHTERPFIARMIHRFAVPIILAWLAVIVLISVFIPSLEEVGQER
jgi:putative drug exporter of the RND superfamily